MGSILFLIAVLVLFVIKIKHHKNTPVLQDEQTIENVQDYSDTVQNEQLSNTTKEVATIENKKSKTNKIKLGDSEVISSDKKLKFSKMYPFDIGQTINQTNGSPFITNGEFQQIKFTITNISLSNISIKLKDLKLTDQNGRIYTPNLDATTEFSLTDALVLDPTAKGAVYDLKPSIPTSVTIIFEVASDSQTFWLDFNY